MRDIAQGIGGYILRLLGTSSAHTLSYAFQEPVNRCVTRHEAREIGEQIDDNSHIKKQEECSEEWVWPSLIHVSPPVRILITRLPAGRRSQRILLRGATGYGRIPSAVAGADSTLLPAATIPPRHGACNIVSRFTCETCLDLYRGVC